MSTLYILWDESHIWGLLLWRAAEALGLPYRLVKGEEIAHGLLSCNPPALLLVPGGTARLKADALGTSGMAAIRDYVARGGHYLGFCGGAGLGLSGDHGLGLCPWSRASFSDRMQHFVSGHVHAAVREGHHLVPGACELAAPLPPTLPAEASSSATGASSAMHRCPSSCPAPSTTGAQAETGQAQADCAPVTAGVAPLLPIWWPGRFAPESTGDVEVLASYTVPGPDFWVADLPLDTLPPGTFAEWEALYGIHLRPTFLEGQPCILHGHHGRGTYTLSYSHLETPGSPAANHWLVHLVETLSGTLRATAHEVPAWDLDTLPVRWEDPALLRARALFDDIVTVGVNHSLFFRRNAWLIGWRAGIPGANLNNLHAAICTAVSMPPCKTAERYWKENRDAFLRDLTLFHQGVTGYLLAERLAMTLSKTFPETVSRQSLKEQRTALFGPPMASGGLYLRLLETLDTLVFLGLAHNA